MNFQSQSAKSNNLRLQQPLSVCSNLRRSLERVLGISFYLLFAMNFEVRGRWEKFSVFPKFPKLSNLPKLRTPLIAHTCRYSLAQSKISCLKKFFLIESKETKNAYICKSKTIQ